MILVFLILLITVNAYSTDIITLENLKPNPVSSNMEYLEDKNNNLLIEEITSPKYEKQFKNTEEDYLNFGFTNSVYWIKFTINNNFDSDENWILEIKYPLIDKAELFYKTETGEFKKKRTGDIYKFRQREVSYRNLAFYVPINKQKEQTFYLRFETESSMQIGLVLWPPAVFAAEISEKNYFFGIYYGIMIVMILYNFFIYFSTREKSFIHYSLYIGGFTLFEMSLNGLGSQFIWFNFPVIANISVPFFIGFASYWMLSFTREFLNMKKTSKKINKLLVFGMFTAFSIALTTIAVPYKISIKYAAIMGMLAPIITIIAGITGFRKKYRPAKYFLVAFSLFLLGCMLYALSSFGLLPSNFITHYGMQIGSAIQVILLSLGLGDKINTLEKEKKEFQEQALKNKELVVESLKKAHKLKDEFLANTSHELRTPLNGIIGIAESMLDGAAGEITPVIAANLSIITNSSRRLANLVNDILDISKLRNGQIELQKKPVYLKPITDIVLALSRPLAGNKPISLVNKISSDLQPVLADENRLQQILYNLVGNAIKFTEMGRVTVTAKVKEEKAEINIIDTGIGIPEEKLDLIFESFEQADKSISREYGGTGLGLSITKKLVELHGGKITISSTEGKGTSVTFTLPLSEDLPEPERHSISAENIEKITKLANDLYDNEFIEFKGNYNILAVDDEPVNLKVIVNNLKIHNYNVTSCLSGLDALNLVNSEYKFDLVLLDIMMPKMSGYEVCRKIREKHSMDELPIILLTAKNQVSDLIEGFESGANDYITKPISKGELAARIKTHIQLSKISTAYSKFVPREFLRFLDKESILDVKLGDQIQKEMTILFMDIRGFTSLSEVMSPKENFDFLNTYLEKIGPIIRANNGFIDKYIGDAVLALFPGRVEDALNAAIKIFSEIEILNKSETVKGAIKIGAGLHTGSLMLGTIGEKERMEGTVISHSVNLASRMEGLTKVYGSSIILSETSFERLEEPNRFHFRYLGRVKVKGKSDSVKIYEIYEGDTPHGVLTDRTKRDFEEGIDLYNQRDFDNALEKFKTVLKLNPGDEAAEFYHTLCERYILSGIPDEWEAIVDLDRKL